MSNGFQQSFGKDEKGVTEKEVSFKEDYEQGSSKNYKGHQNAKKSLKNAKIV